MTYFSMFSGIGGFEIPLEELGFECVGYSEIDKYAIQVYQSHFINHHNYGDATRIIASELPDFDLLVGGFPCQAFSVAGKRRGFDDTRGTLFFDIARILKEKRPRFFILENVKGLLSHDHGRTFKTIISTLAELGYSVEWEVLNSKNFGVPQNRERVFIVGYLGGGSGRKIFPLIGQTSDSPTEHSSSEPLVIGSSQKHAAVSRGIVPTLSTAMGQGGGQTPMVAGTTNQPQIENGMRIRRLTPTECERLQAYPRGWTKCVSDTQRYKTLGNAVTVNVVRELTQRLFGEPRASLA
jgi:DNA (cytosine-5)-methyltransferase 1